MQGGQQHPEKGPRTMNVPFKSTRTDGPPTDVGGVEKLKRDAVTLLASVRSSLGDLLRTVESGEATGGDLKAIAEQQALLQRALEKVQDAEKKYYDWIVRNGGHDPADIDYDAIRDQIGCRLARLRDCCQEE
jgi:hypothetical protein